MLPDRFPMSMLFPEPMPSLNPVMRIGDQITGRFVASGH